MVIPAQTQHSIRHQVLSGEKENIFLESHCASFHHVPSCPVVDSRMGFPSPGPVESNLSVSIQRNEGRRFMLVPIEMLGKSLDSNVMLRTHLVHVYVAGLDSGVHNGRESEMACS